MSKIIDLKQGTKFIYNGKYYMKLPDFVECYDMRCDAINLMTGTMAFINPIAEVKEIDPEILDMVFELIDTEVE